MWKAYQRRQSQFRDLVRDSSSCVGVEPKGLLRDGTQSYHWIMGTGQEERHAQMLSQQYEAFYAVDAGNIPSVLDIGKPELEATAAYRHTTVRAY